MFGKEIVSAVENSKILDVRDTATRALSEMAVDRLREKTKQTIAKVYVKEDAEDIFLKNVAKRIQGRVADHKTISPELAGSSSDHRPTDTAPVENVLPKHPQPVASKGSDQYDNPQRQGIELGTNTKSIEVKEDVYRQLSGLCRNHHATVDFTFENGAQRIPVSTQLARNLKAVHDSLDEENQAMFESMLQTYRGFHEMVNFAKFQG